MKIVSGKTGTPHVTSQQFRQILEGTIGQDSYILTSGENLEPELSTNNLLKIKSGMMSHHGNVSSVELGTYDEVTIANGSQGMKRIDLIVNRYSRNEETGVEQNSWVVIQGTPAASSPAVPSHTVGNLQEGDLVDDCPVFEVHLDGINVTEVKKLLSVTENMSTLNANLSSNIVRRETSLSLSVNANQYKAVSQPQTSVPGYTYFLGICGVAGAGSQNIVPYRAFATNLSDTFGVTNVGGVNTPSAELRIVQIFVKKFIDES